MSSRYGILLVIDQLMVVDWLFARRRDLPLGVDGNGGNTELSASLDDSACNLSTVGDQDLANGLSLSHCNCVRGE